MWWSWRTWLCRWDVKLGSLEYLKLWWKLRVVVGVWPQQLMWWERWKGEEGLQACRRDCGGWHGWTGWESCGGLTWGMKSFEWYLRVGGTQRQAVGRLGWPELVGSTQTDPHVSGCGQWLGSWKEGGEGVGEMQDWLMSWVVAVNSEGWEDSGATVNLNVEAGLGGKVSLASVFGLARVGLTGNGHMNLNSDNPLFSSSPPLCPCGATARVNGTCGAG